MARQRLTVSKMSALVSTGESFSISVVLDGVSSAPSIYDSLDLVPVHVRQMEVSRLSSRDGIVCFYVNVL